MLRHATLEVKLVEFIQHIFPVRIFKFNNIYFQLHIKTQKNITKNQNNKNPRHPVRSSREYGQV